MTSMVGGALEWLAGRLQPSGDAVIRGLEQDLARETTADGSWLRVCEAAWTLGFVELRFVPAPEVADLLPERHDFAPRPWPMPDPDDARPDAQSTWTFGLTSGGRTVATLTARRRLGRVDFEPMSFVALAQGVVERFVVLPGTPDGRPVGAAAQPDVPAVAATPPTQPEPGPES